MTSEQIHTDSPLKRSQPVDFVDQGMALVTLSKEVHQRRAIRAISVETCCIMSHMMRSATQLVSLALNPSYTPPPPCQAPLRP
jgi:hypothetical protein